MTLQWREAYGKLMFTESHGAMKIPSLRRHPRRAIHSLRYHIKMNRQPKAKPNSRKLLRLCRKPVRELLHKVVRGGVCSVAAQVQAADHRTMAIARRAIKSSLVECTQQLQLHLTEHIDQSTHVTHEQVLGRIAQRFPKYESVISANPAVAECIPEDLKKDLVVRAQSRSFQIALVLLKTWAK